MSAQNTPGPWESRNNFTVVGPKDDDGRWVICHSVSEHEIDKANLRLIGAAPQLFAFANHPVMEWLLTDGVEYLPEPQRTSVKTFLVASRTVAIAKARGTR